MKNNRKRRQPPITHATGGFTLVEILMVMAIMTLMMGMAMVAFVDWGKDAKIRTAERGFRTAFHHARQDAITYRRRTLLVFGNVLLPGATDPTRGWYAVTTNLPSTPPAPPDYIPEYVLGSGDVIADGVLLGDEIASTLTPYDDANVQYIEFKLDGSCGDAGPDITWSGNQANIVLFEAQAADPGIVNYLSSTVTVFKLTGTILRRDLE